MRYLGMRTLTQFLNGHHPGPDASICKLYWSEYHRRVTELARRHPRCRRPGAVGSLAVHVVPDRRRRGAEQQSASWVGMFLNARAGTIYAGTSQIQRNILGEMVLGLPKEPKPTVTCGFSAVARRPRSGRPRSAGAATARRLVAAGAVPARAVAEYLRFRLVTQYGDPSPRARCAELPPWCRTGSASMPDG